MCCAPVVLLAFLATNCGVGETADQTGGQNTNPGEANTITVQPGQRHQTITGWEATAQAGQVDSRSFDLYRDALFDRAVNDLGLSRLRVEIRPATENRADFFGEFLAGRLDEKGWVTRSCEIVNDNSDPSIADPTGFTFTELDHTVEHVVLPIRQRLEARGERLFLNLAYVGFCGGRSLHRDQPQDYAELALAVYVHLQQKYGFVPDAWEVILEPDNAGWSGNHIGRVIAASGARLQSQGFKPAFIAPSTTSMATAISYFDDLVGIAGAKEFLFELSYHRYSGVSVNALTSIANRAASRGIGAAMLEHIGSGYEDLHQDLKIGQNTAWQQYTLAYGPGDDGGQYFVVNDNISSQPKIILSSRARMLRQYFRYVRPGAVRLGATGGGATFDPLAFQNADGSYVVVVKGAEGGEFRVQGLPAGTYQAHYTTAGEDLVALGEQRVGASESVPLRLPAPGVITLHGKPGSGATAGGVPDAPPLTFPDATGFKGASR